MKLIKFGLTCQYCTNQRKKELPLNLSICGVQKCMCVYAKFYTWCIWQDKSIQHKEKKVALSGAYWSDRSHKPVCPRQPVKNNKHTITRLKSTVGPWTCTEVSSRSMYLENQLNRSLNLCNGSFRSKIRFAKLFCPAWTPRWPSWLAVTKLDPSKICRKAPMCVLCFI